MSIVTYCYVKLVFKVGCLTGEVQREDSRLFSLISCFTYLRSATATVSFEELEANHFRVLPAIKEKIDYCKVFPFLVVLKQRRGIPICFRP